MSWKIQRRILFAIECQMKNTFNVINPIECQMTDGFWSESNVSDTKCESETELDLRQWKCLENPESGYKQ